MEGGGEFVVEDKVALEFVSRWRLLKMVTQILLSPIQKPTTDLFGGAGAQPLRYGLVRLRVLLFHILYICNVL